MMCQICLLPHGLLFNLFAADHKYLGAKTGIISILHICLTAVRRVRTKQPSLTIGCLKSTTKRSVSNTKITGKAENKNRQPLPALSFSGGLLHIYFMPALCASGTMVFWHPEISQRSSILGIKDLNQPMWKKVKYSWAEIARDKLNYNPLQCPECKK